MSFHHITHNNVWIVGELSVFNNSFCFLNNALGNQFMHICCTRLLLKVLARWIDTLFRIPATESVQNVVPQSVLNRYTAGIWTSVQVSSDLIFPFKIRRHLYQIHLGDNYKYANNITMLLKNKYETMLGFDFDDEKMSQEIRLKEKIHKTGVMNNYIGDKHKNIKGWKLIVRQENAKDVFYLNQIIKMNKLETENLKKIPLSRILFSKSNNMDICICSNASKSKQEFIISVYNLSTLTHYQNLEINKNSSEKHTNNKI